MVLEYIEVRNFQKHRRLRVELDPQVTSVICPSDGGKSSLLRALTWAALNQASDKEFLTWGQTFTRVTLGMDGRKVVRKRKGGANTYALDDQTWKAFGLTVPEPLANLVNLSEVNFSGQHDRHFWFSLTPGQVSKELNSIVNLEVIDSSLANAAARVRKHSSMAEVSRERLKGMREEKKALAFVGNLDAKLGELEEEEAGLERLREKAELLGGMIEEAELKQGEKKRLSLLAEKGAEAVKAGERFFSLQGKVWDLGDLLDEAVDAEKVASLDLSGFDLLEKEFEKLERVRDEADELGTLVREAGRLTKLMREKAQQADEAEEELHRRTKGKCPLCGKEMK